jgi:hypothetical protein
MRIVRDKIKVTRHVVVTRTLPDAREIAEEIVKQYGDLSIYGDNMRDNFGSISAMKLGWKSLEWLPILAAAVLDKPVYELFPHHKFPKLSRRKQKHEKVSGDIHQS